MTKNFHYCTIKHIGLHRGALHLAKKEDASSSLLDPPDNKRGQGREASAYLPLYNNSQNKRS
jgi:hypothetical protein